MRKVRSQRSGVHGLWPRLSFGLATLVVAGVTAGCGGGGGSSSSPAPTTRTVNPQITIQWAARSRAISLPSSALSAIVTLQGAAIDGADATFTVDRTSSTNAYTQTFTGTNLVREGTFPITIRVYGQPDGAAPLVAQGSGTATIGSDGMLPSVTLTGSVASVSIAAGQSLLVGQTTDLTVTAYDSTHSIVAVTPGSIFLNFTGSTSALTNTGGGPTVQGILSGTATVTASVDGVTSSAVSVSVTSNAVVTISPASPPILNIGATQIFTATVANAPSSVVTWSIQEGAAGGTITQLGTYTAPNTTGTYHVVATSVFDPSRKATVAVSVENGSVTIGVGFPGSGGVDATVN